MAFDFEPSFFLGRGGDFDRDPACFLLAEAWFFFDEDFDLDLDFCLLSFDLDFFLVFLTCGLLLLLGPGLLCVLLCDFFFFGRGESLGLTRIFFLVVAGLLSFLRLSCLPSPSTSEEEARGDATPPPRSTLGVSSSVPTKVQSSSSI